MKINKFIMSGNRYLLHLLQVVLLFFIFISFCLILHYFYLHLIIQLSSVGCKKGYYMFTIKHRLIYGNNRPEDLTLRFTQKFQDIYGLHNYVMCQYSVLNTCCSQSSILRDVIDVNSLSTWKNPANRYIYSSTLAFIKHCYIS